ncbi:hypothetical protein HanPI659440_Chr16g0647601 [Helianthus annuus]|nr:hypothetical protein HanPI659440_Chr16g0647601 [Helianthus annuus]
MYRSVLRLGDGGGWLKLEKARGRNSFLRFRSSVKSSNSGCVSAIRAQDLENILVLKSNYGGG